MVYPTLTDNFNLATLNANFLELYNQMNVAKSYMPTATNLGTISVHRAMVKSGIGRYVLRANSGTWVSGNFYILCTLDSDYRPSSTAMDCLKEIIIAPNTYAKLYIQSDGVVRIYARTNITNSAITIDETYII